jgi:trans-2,3-dihydro-3-hydroxyanthranilate isomerase
MITLTSHRILMRFLQVDVFAESAFRGNPLAVFPDAATLTTQQMQSIAREMNLSETTFVTSSSDTRYDVRIFTPEAELPFAGHPTIGTTWVLRYLGRLRGDVTEQWSDAGVTTVERIGELHWLQREETAVEESFELSPGSLGLTADEVGCSLHGTRLTPSLSSAGFTQLMVPVADADTLARAHPARDVPYGVYCFTPVGPQRLRARGFFPTYGIPEDPATGSAAAALGLYLARRIGSSAVTIEQGAQCGRPSILETEFQPRSVRVGGRCVLVATGELTVLP